MLPVLKILTPHILKKIMSYVFEENELDQEVKDLKSRLENLEKDSHPPVDWNEEILIIKTRLDNFQKHLTQQDKGG